MHTKNRMSTQHSPRDLEHLVDERIKRWKRTPAHEKAMRRLPVVAISRQAGSLGGQVAHRLADELGMDLYGDELVGLIARTTHISERVVRTLDEKGVTFLDDMLGSLIVEHSLGSDAYFHVLAKIIATIDWHGNAVILGRGAAYMIHGRGDLRIRFTAPLRLRIENVMAELGLSEEGARRHLDDVEEDRARFVQHYFRVGPDEVRHFDLTVNNESVDLDCSLAIVKAALQSRMQSGP